VKQLQKLAMDAWRAPQSILFTHAPYEIAKLAIDQRPATQIAGLPAPPGPKTRTMPPNECLRPDDSNGISDAREQAVEPDKQRAINTG
jgi:hypothetical protein